MNDKLNKVASDPRNDGSSGVGPARHSRLKLIIGLLRNGDVRAAEGNTFEAWNFYETANELDPETTAEHLGSFPELRGLIEANDKSPESTVPNLDLDYNEPANPEPAPETSAALEGRQKATSVSDEPGTRAKLAHFISYEATAEELAQVARIAARKLAPLADRLQLMSLKERKAALHEHYKGRSSWADVRSEKPTPDEMRDWLDLNFPDRRAVGMVFSDLRKLDPEAGKKIENWKKDGLTSDDFGLPSKVEKFSPADLENLPASGDIFAAFKAGEPTKAIDLNRKRARAHYHMNKA